MPATLNTAAARTRYEIGLQSLERSRHLITKMIETFPEGKWLHAPCPGGNHMLWEIGHLAWADDFFLAPASGESAKLAHWKNQFGIGSAPTTDPAANPTPGEVTDALVERRRALLTWLGTLSDEQLAEPLPEPLSGFAESRAAMTGALAGHEMMHAGQITVVRKALALPRVFM